MTPEQERAEEVAVILAAGRADSWPTEGDVSSSVCDAEGWFLSDDVRIVRDDAAAIFADDEAAEAHVRRCAEAGSGVHIRALWFVAQADERERQEGGDDGEA